MSASGMTNYIMRHLGGNEDPAHLQAGAEVLRRGDLVVVPTETVYGVAGSGSSPQGIAKLRAVRAALRPGLSLDESGYPGAWHAASVEELLGKVPLRSALHRRLIHRMLPGAVTLMIELTPTELARALSTTGLLSGAADDGRVLVVRVPDHAGARALGSMAGVPIVAEGVIDAQGRGAGDAVRAAEILSGAGARGIGMVLDGGVARYGRASTAVRLSGAGDYTVVREGPVSSAEIAERTRRRVLFVCTGNTCRSPMAEALATALAESGPGSVPTEFASAGLTAGRGVPASPETVVAVRALGVEHRYPGSRALTGAMIRWADAVFVMTRGHRAGVLEIDAESAGKVSLLDPSGRDVDDPIGAGQRTYSELAKSMRRMIQARLQELDQ